MPDVDPSEFSKVAKAVAPETFDPEFDDDTPIATPKRDREGLPPGYRMRADAHYVDQLSSARKATAEAPRAVSGDAPGSDRADRPADFAERDRRIDKLLAQLSEDVATITAAAGLLSGDASVLARRVNLDLIKSQSWRAAWLLRANAIVAGTHEIAIRPRPLAFVLGQVRAGFASECRLNGITLNIHASDWNAVVALDEAAAIAGMTGALLATFGLVGQGEGSVVTLAANVEGRELRSVDISQGDVHVTAGIANRFFDAGWAGRAGGWLAAFGAATASAAAQLHGGEATILPAEGTGGVVRLTFAKH